MTIIAKCVNKAKKYKYKKNQFFNDKGLIKKTKINT